MDFSETRSVFLECFHDVKIFRFNILLEDYVYLFIPEYEVCVCPWTFKLSAARAELEFKNLQHGVGKFLDSRFCTLRGCGCFF